MTRTQLALAALCLVAAAIGCRSEPSGPNVVPPPSFVRSTVPADSAEHVVGPTDISITFRNSVLESGVVLDLFPAPHSAGGQILSPTGRNLTWRAVEFDANEPIYRLLVDGVAAPSPEQFLYFPGTVPNGGRMGGCLSLAAEGLDLTEAVVFSIPPGDSDVSQAELPTLFDAQHASSIALVSSGECATFYFFTYLKLEPVVVIAVIDTSGDGRYDLHDDWWGYRGTVSAADIITPSASPFDIPMDLDITLRAPPR